MKTMTNYARQRQMEKNIIISNARCQLCQSLIGDREYLVYKERYFHKQCLKKDNN